MWLESGLRGVRSSANSGVFEGYCFAELQVPPQPSERRHVPEPLRPESRPVLVKVTPWPWPNVLTEPPVLTVPRTPSPMILPELTTTAPLVLPPQPTLTTAQAPSKPPPPPPPPPPLRRGDERSSVAGLLRREGAAGSAERPEEVSWREPDSDFSSLPMEPPALPDCAKADDEARARLRRDARAIVRTTALGMRKQSEMKKVSAAGAVGADGSDNAASFASLAAFVKRGIPGVLDAVALDQRPGFV
jgi:hypothetical protein